MNMNHRTTPPRSYNPQQRHRNTTSIFQVSNPSASDNHDQDQDQDHVQDQDQTQDTVNQTQTELGLLEYASPPSSVGHCHHCHQPQPRVGNTKPTTDTGSLPPLVVDEKRWRRQLLQRSRREAAKSKREREIQSDVDLSQTTTRSWRGRSDVSPPRYTPDGFVYPETDEREGEEEACSYAYDYAYSHSYSREEEEGDVGVSRMQLATTRTRMSDRQAQLPNPYPTLSYPEVSSYACDAHTGQNRNRTKMTIYTPQPRRYAPPPLPPATEEHYVSNVNADPNSYCQSPPVLFADVRPLTIRRRRRFATQMQTETEMQMQTQTQTRFQVTNHHRLQQQQQSRPQFAGTPTGMKEIGGSRRHSEGQGLSHPHPHPDPYSYPDPYSSGTNTPTAPMRMPHGIGSSHGEPSFSSQYPQYQPGSRTGYTPEFMGMSSSTSHDRSYPSSSSALNNKRTASGFGMGYTPATPHRLEPEHSRERHPPSVLSSFAGNPKPSLKSNSHPTSNIGMTRCPPIPIRLAVQGLSYVGIEQEPQGSFSNNPNPNLSTDFNREFHHHLPLPTRPSAVALSEAHGVSGMNERNDMDVLGGLGLGLGTPRPAPRPPPLPMSHSGGGGGVSGDTCNGPQTAEGKAKMRERTVSSQPRPHPGMETKTKPGGGGGNRNFKQMPCADNGKRDWSTDLCLFCDHNLGTCCKALWCPCIIYGRNKARLEHLSSSADDDDDDDDDHANDKKHGHRKRTGTFSKSCFAHACLTTATLCLFGWALQVPNRAAIRRRYGIEGDWLGDCAAAVCCSSCELAQESREIDLEERSLLVGRSRSSEARRGRIWDKGDGDNDNVG